GYNNTDNQPYYRQPASGAPRRTEPLSVPPMVPQAAPVPQHLPPSPSARKGFRTYPVQQSRSQATEYREPQFQSRQPNRNMNRAYQPKLSTPQIPSIQTTGGQQPQTTQKKTSRFFRLPQFPRFKTSRR
ncbi:hypothetical protein MNBD_PLANCTO02-1116, partial [hydrothermal vent metagenome]